MQHKILYLQKLQNPILNLHIIPCPFFLHSIRSRERHNISCHKQKNYTIKNMNNFLPLTLQIIVKNLINQIYYTIYKGKKKRKKMTHFTSLVNSKCSLSLHGFNIEIQMFKGSTHSFCHIFSPWY